MARSVKEWIGNTDDTRAPPRVRLRIYDYYNGICQLSKREILVGETWELHHSKALIEGGENRESNLIPVLVSPHKAETKRQMAEKKKINAIRKNHIGITKPKNSIKSRGFQQTTTSKRTKLSDKIMARPAKFRR